MKHLKKVFVTLLIAMISINMIIPVWDASAASKYGVILGTKEYDYKLYHNLTVLSPAGNIMVKAYSLCKGLGLSYSYNSDTKKLTIKNPSNGKYLVFTKGSKFFSYYASKTSAPVSKTAAYKCYYHTVLKSNVIHVDTLKYIVNYYSYKDVSDNYYGKMGYQGIYCYSINAYSTYDMPITDEVLNYVNAKTFTSTEELLDAIRLNLIERKSGVVLKTNRKVMENIGTSTSLLHMIPTLDDKDTSKDADYLSRLVKNYKWSWYSTSTKRTYPDGREETIKSASDPVSLTISMQYYSTLMQERMVDSKVAGILKTLKLTEVSDYEKVKKIHDYVINLASYDTSYTRSTAYELLVNKSAVCEGYTLSAYRLFTDAGLECKIITGTGKGEGHAWNIVKVKGKWYNIDLTWDDPISSSGKPILRYDYFLKNEADFTYHKRDPEWKTEQFLKTYPIAGDSYQ